MLNVILKVIFHVKKHCELVCYVDWGRSYISCYCRNIDNVILKLDVKDEVLVMDMYQLLLFHSFHEYVVNLFKTVMYHLIISISRALFGIDETWLCSVIN